MIHPLQFSQLARSLTIDQISSPFLARYESSLTVSDIFDEWTIRLCGEKGLDPDDQISLVVTNGQPVGWIGYDMLEAGEILENCMEPVTIDSTLPSNTSLLDFASKFAIKEINLFLVSDGNQYIGWLTYEHLHTTPLRFSLFAMLIDLERLLLKVALLSPEISIALLPEGRIQNAKRVYKIRGYQKKGHLQYYNSKLLECTTMIDKFTICRRLQSLLERVPKLANKRLCNTTERLRNEIAHCALEQESSKILSRQTLLPFVQWIEELQTQLESYLNTIEY